MSGLWRVDCDHAKQSRGLLLDRDALALHVLRQFGEGNLHPVIDVHRVDVGIGAKLERHQKRVAAIIAAYAFHVDHLVDADDLRLDRLRDGRVDHCSGGTRVAGRNRYLGRDDVRVLRERNSVEGDQTGDRSDDGDDNR